MIPTVKWFEGYEWLFGQTYGVIVDPAINSEEAGNDTTIV